MKNLVTFLFLSILTGQSASATVPKVLYGNDDRQEVSEFSNTMFQELAQSVAGRVSSYDLIPVSNSEAQNSMSNSYRSLAKIYADLGIDVSKLNLPILDNKEDLASEVNFYNYDVDTLGDRINACSSERFREQPTLMSCTGFLVGPDLLVTAGHCMTSNFDCSGNKWVFGFKKGVTKIPADSVYNCAEVVAQEQVTNPFLGTTDYAIIRLDRVVKNRAPLKFRTSGKIKSKTPVLVIGHPMGLPLKIADNATVKGTFGKTFRANLDTYGGNSGSPVFNVKTGLVEGILVQGSADIDYSGACSASRLEEGRKEVIYKITRLKALQNLFRKNEL